MGRPIKKKFFGNINAPGGKSGVGGEGIASVSVSGSPTGKTPGTYDATIDVPAIAGGTLATGEVTVNANGSTMTFRVTNPGSGYLTVPSVTCTAANAGGSRTATFTATLTTDRQNALAIRSFLLAKDGGSSAVNNGDIIKQEASLRYLVQNSQGKGQCKLVTTSTLTAGTMNLIATDFNGSTYFVKKLTARQAVVVRSTSSGGGFLVADNHQTGWTINAATGTVVTISDTI